VLVLAGPELGQTRPAFGTGRNRSTLRLDPLDPASMDALVDALVPGMPDAARAKITGQAQGIPLFAVEMVRSLIDHDIVQPVEGVYRLAGEVGELAVPDSLHALLAARLDALDPEVRRLFADASVLGSTFPAEALIAVSAQEETLAQAALADLVRREVLSVSADQRGSPGRGVDQHGGGFHRRGPALAIDEARTIATRLRCQPLLDRAAGLDVLGGPVDHDGGIKRRVS
jgi:predicted ATPase